MARRAPRQWSQCQQVRATALRIPTRRASGPLSQPCALPLSIFHPRSPKSKTAAFLLGVSDAGHPRLPESRMLSLQAFLSSYLASPPGRSERSGQAHLCEALLQAEAEAEPKPRVKPEPENLCALSMAPAAVPRQPTVPAPLQPLRPHPVANLSPGTPACPTSSTARVGRGRSLLGHPAHQPPRVLPAPPAGRLSSVICNDCGRGHPRSPPPPEPPKRSTPPFLALSDRGHTLDAPPDGRTGPCSHLCPSPRPQGLSEGLRPQTGAQQEPSRPFTIRP